MQGLLRDLYLRPTMADAQCTKPEVPDHARTWSDHQPLKKHGDKIDVGRLGGADNEDGLIRQAGPASRRPRRWNLRSRAASVGPSLPLAASVRGWGAPQRIKRLAMNHIRFNGSNDIGTLTIMPLPV